jgi:hypothetical protein
MTSTDDTLYMQKAADRVQRICRVRRWRSGIHRIQSHVQLNQSDEARSVSTLMHHPSTLSKRF